MTEYAEDCLHLHACRRICSMSDKRIVRNCHPDRCNCYVSKEQGEYISVDEAIEYARDGVSSIRSGYDPYDVYCSIDLRGKTLGELVEEN